MFVILVVTVVIGVLMYRLDDDFTLAFFGIAIGIVLGFMVAMLIGLSSPAGDTYHNRASLNNIQDNDVMHASFFLGSGNIDGIPQYSFYVETSKNSYERRDVEASLATIHYTSEKPYLNYTYKQNDRFIYPFFVNVAAHVKTDEHYDFYIPRGSVVNEYRLDAK